MTEDQIRLDAIADAIGSIERNRDRFGSLSGGRDGGQGFFLAAARSIGANAATLCPALRESHPDIPWTDVIAMRDLSREDDAPDGASLAKAVDVTLPQLASRLFDLARDALRMQTDLKEPDVAASAGGDFELEADGSIKLDDIRARREEIKRIASRRGASNIRVFGSVARGEAKPYSDIDFLVDMDPGRSLLDLGGLLMDLQELFDWPVDVSSPRAGVFRDRVSAQAVAI